MSGERGVRVCVLGAGGMLARDLIAQAPAGVELAPRTHQETDVTAEPAVAALLREVQPTVVINCAAYSNVDRAEIEPEAALAVNGVAPGIISQAVRRTGNQALVIHYSTDYVFNGRARRPYTESHATDPLGAYGASKLAGEQALRASGVPHLIIRTQWLFGLKGRSFPRTMWERATGGKPTRVVNDQVGRPTYTVDLARATWRLVAASGPDPLSTWWKGGTFVSQAIHVANRGTATWYDVARRVFEAVGVPQLLSACSTAAYPTPAKRPAYSVLDTANFEALTRAPLPAWEDAVDRFLGEMQAEGAP